MKYQGFRNDKQVDLTIDYRADGINATMGTIVPYHIFIEIMQLAERKRHHIVKTYYARWMNFQNPTQNVQSNINRIKYSRNEVLPYKLFNP